MTDLEKQLTIACWKAWKELNTIRARDGIPYCRDGYASGVDEYYFGSVVEECKDAVVAATGKPITPWQPKIS